MRSGVYFLVSLVCAAAVVVLFSGPMLADDGDDDHERARQALEGGEILPLQTLIKGLERDYPGQILEVELEREDGLWVYEIKLIRHSGALVKLELDARNGTLLKIEGRDTAPAQQREH